MPSTWTEYDLHRALITGDNTGAAWYARRDYEDATPEQQRAHRDAIRRLGLELPFTLAEICTAIRPHVEALTGYPELLSALDVATSDPTPKAAFAAAEQAMVAAGAAGRAYDRYTTVLGESMTGDGMEERHAESRLPKLQHAIDVAFAVRYCCSATGLQLQLAEHPELSDSAERAMVRATASARRLGSSSDRAEDREARS